MFRATARRDFHRLAGHVAKPPAPPLPHTQRCYAGIQLLRGAGPNLQHGLLPGRCRFGGGSLCFGVFSEREQRAVARRKQMDRVGWVEGASVCRRGVSGRGQRVPQRGCRHSTPRSTARPRRGRAAPAARSPGSWAPTAVCRPSPTPDAGCPPLPAAAISNPRIMSHPSVPSVAVRPVRQPLHAMSTPRQVLMCGWPTLGATPSQGATGICATQTPATGRPRWTSWPCWTSRSRCAACGFKLSTMA